MTDKSNHHDTGGSVVVPKPRRRRVRKFNEIFDGTTDLLFEPIFWIGDGKSRRRVSIEQVMLRRQYRDAMEGQKSGMKFMIKIIRANQKVREAEQRFHPPYVPEGYEDPRNADAALLILGLATVRREELDALRHMDKAKPRRWGLAIEPGLVAAAMARSDAPHLNRKQAEAISRRTRDADSPPVEEAELEGAPLYDPNVLPRDPCETRFKPGKSGNPKGRPVKVKLDLPFEGFLTEVIVVPFEGKMREMTRLDALFWEMAKRAIGRDDRVEQMLFNLLLEERMRKFKHCPGATVWIVRETRY